MFWVWVTMASLSNIISFGADLSVSLSICWGVLSKTLLGSGIRSMGLRERVLLLGTRYAWA